MDEQSRKDYQRAYYESHKEQRKEYDKQYREQHREQRKALSRAWFKSHKNEEAYKEKQRESHRRYRAKTKGKRAIRDSDKRKLNLEEFKARERESRKRLKEKVFSLLGDHCARCGFSDARALQIDHINGGGHRERKQLGSWSSYLNHILLVKAIGYQILCANCNSIKKHENKEYFNPNTVYK